MNDYSFVRRNSIIIICFIALYKIKKKISVYHSIFQINFLIFLSIDFQKLHLKNMYIITFIENLNFYFLQHIDKKNCSNINAYTDQKFGQLVILIQLVF